MRKKEEEEFKKVPQKLKSWVNQGITKQGANDEPINSRFPKKPLDDQSAIKQHLMHGLLHIDKHVDMTIGKIFKSNY